MSGLDAANERYKMLAHLKDACAECKMCELGWRKATRGAYNYNPHVFSNYTPMSPTAKFMIVGQNPGWNEVKEGMPFIGAAGKNFDDALLKNTRWTRGDFYITNSIKCFTKDNKPPSHQNLNRCEPFLRMEISIIKPKLVITFGSVAFGILCGCKFSDNIGKIVDSDKFGVKVFTTYHPSPLNLANPQRKKKFYQDIRTIGKIMDHYLSPF